MFETQSISETKKILACSEEQALKNLENVARDLVKYARWYGYMTKIRQLQKPLVQLKLARKLNESKVEL